MLSRKLIKLLKDAGWVQVRTNGDHFQFKHPDSADLITATHPRKDLPAGLLNRILKTAGLK